MSGRSHAKGIVARIVNGMARRRREWIEGDLYHLFSRGSNRQAIVMNDGDLLDLESILFSALDEHEIEVFAWCLMPNHWHCLVRSPEVGLSRFMQTVNHRHSLRFNRRWGRSAHLFENRFGAVLQESQEQLLWTIRYVLRNPVEAGLAAMPADVRWSSYRATVGQGEAPAGFRPDAVLALFASPSRGGREGLEEFVSAEPRSPLQPSRRRVDRALAVA
jgi:REP-associated tyrosine transposase